MERRARSQRNGSRDGVGGDILVCRRSRVTEMYGCNLLCRFCIVQKSKDYNKVSQARLIMSRSRRSSINKLPYNFLTVLRHLVTEGNPRGGRGGMYQQFHPHTSSVLTVPIATIDTGSINVALAQNLVPCRNLPDMGKAVLRR